MEPLPAEPVTIEYQTPETTPWRPMVRLMATATIAKGATTALYFMYYLSNYSFPMHRALRGLELLVFITTLLPALLNLGLIGGGWLSWRFEARGRSIVIWLSAITVVLAVISSIIQAVLQASAVSNSLRFIAPNVLNLCMTLVLPITIWVFFRRPEVEAAMTRE